MNLADEKIWLDGRFLSALDPVFCVNDRGLALGDGLFETIRVDASQPCFFDDHWHRLCASAKALRFTLSCERAAIFAALHDLAHLNQVRIGAARLMLTRGSGLRGLALPTAPKPHMVITMTTGLPVCKTPPVLGLSAVRRNPYAPADAHKTLSYMNSIAARLHQTGHQHREEVVMLDTDGHIASASAANLFWWQDGTLHTPALNGAVLPGTMRARVLELARNCGIELREGGFAPKSLLGATGAFITNALIGVQAVAGVDFGSQDQTAFNKAQVHTAGLRDALALLMDR